MAADPKSFKVVVDCDLPSLPNFVTIHAFGGSGTIDIKELSEDDLRVLGAKWTDALIDHARKRKGGD